MSRSRAVAIWLSPLKAAPALAVLGLHRVEIGRNDQCQKVQQPRPQVRGLPRQVLAPRLLDSRPIAEGAGIRQFRPLMRVEHCIACCSRGDKRIFPGAGRDGAAAKLK
ncbi:hypothetical protein BMW22_26690 (plasmid) [Rhizobium leguminosarum]|uniref:Secreted protein n=1 Tax=Rhizobium leguminosarum TaxID=384 RepID=A0A1L3ZHS9_RHILE|nr:hypothetical protein BMW22_26690 [Rhizobium leguminosarum]